MLSLCWAAMKLTTFWERMTARFGASYAESVARDLVLSVLGSRTVEEALAAGVEVAEVWAAVCDAVEIPVGERH